jgi:hypothetical protein
MIMNKNKSKTKIKNQNKGLRKTHPFGRKLKFCVTHSNNRGKIYMKTILIISTCFLITSCAPWQEVKAPCTYDDRTGCGEIIYAPENLKTEAGEYQHVHY